MGALDDCLIQGDRYLPLDYKTRGYPVKEETPSYYQNQLNIYTLLLQENGRQPAGCAYLVFYHPLEQNDGGRVTFHMHAVIRKEGTAETAWVGVGRRPAARRKEPGGHAYKITPELEARRPSRAARRPSRATKRAA